MGMRTDSTALPLAGPDVICITSFFVPSFACLMSISFRPSSNVVAASRARQSCREGQQAAVLAGEERASKIE